MHAAVRPLAWLFDPRGRITAQTYLRTGIVLVAVKYAVDAGLVFLATGNLWRPAGYLAPLFSTGTQLQYGPSWLLPVMAIWTLPFLFIGVSLSMRRLVDADFSPWLVLLFFVPWVNYLLMASLCVLPSSIDRHHDVVSPPVEPGSAGDAALALALSIGLTILSVALNTLAMRTYSPGLFLGTPFSIGIVTGYFYNWKRVHTMASTGWVVVGVLIVAAVSLAVASLEGAICLLMAVPLAWVISILGALIGRQMAIRGLEDVVKVGALLLFLPFASNVNARPRLAEYEVVSAVEINAPPEVVWRHVVAFGDLEEPPGFIFQLGIAYPVRATIEGEGVGAIRRCEFSTGAFIEPITVWDAPRRLSFDVTAQPRPMRELSPYRNVRAPHLDGFLLSKRGEFRLVALPGGRTRLEGSTWYTLDMQPGVYWRPMADQLIHAIHLRVLRHISHLAEADRRTP